MLGSPTFEAQCEYGKKMIEFSAKPVCRGGSKNRLARNLLTRLQ